MSLSGSVPKFILALVQPEKASDCQPAIFGFEAGFVFVAPLLDGRFVARILRGGERSKRANESAGRENA